MRAIWLLACLALTGGCEPEAETAEGSGEPMQHTMTATLDTAGLRGLAVPAELQQGRELYDTSCASCHGEAALGTSQGPPLVHIIYEPNHHGDVAFVMAAERGVPAHHWSFGDMPPRPEVSREQVAAIVAYVRWLQREAGVF